MAKRNYDMFDQMSDQWRSTASRNEAGEYIDPLGRTKEDIYSEFADRANELDIVGNIYQTADKIITGESDLSVVVVSDNDMDTTAMNNGKEIIYNANLIEDINADTIASLHGTNYHEVAHILFSPRAGSALCQYVNTNKLVRAFNMAEEGRIESLMIAKYPSTRLFFEAMNNDYMLKDDPSQWADTYPVSTARTYLDIEVRQIVADKFIEKYGLDMARRVNRIMHEYKSLAFPTGFDRAKELLTELSEIVGVDDEPENKEGEGEGKPNPAGACGHLDRKPMTKGRPASGKDQEKLQERAKSGKAGDKEDLGEDKGLLAGGNSETYNTEEKSYEEQDKAIAKRLNERMAEIKSNESVKREINETRNAIKGSEDINSTIVRGETEEREPSYESKSYARRFSQQLERIVRDNDPAWVTHLPSGRLNISRTMNPDINAISEMFDLWDTGNESTDIEAVLLLDNSGSMGGYMQQVCEQAWIIKRGVESINGTVSVFAFDHEAKIIYDKGERAKPNAYRHIWARGNTAPCRTLLETERIMKASDKSVKIAFILTDGQWFDQEESDSAIKRLNDMGVITCVVFLSNYKDYAEMLEESRNGNEYYTKLLSSLKHNAQIFRAVTQPSDVLAIADDLVKSTLVRKVA